MFVAKAFSVVQGIAIHIMLLLLFFYKYFSFTGLSFINMNQKEQQM